MAFEYTVVCCVWGFIQQELSLLPPPLIHLLTHSYRQTYVRTHVCTHAKHSNTAYMYEKFECTRLCMCVYCTCVMYMFVSSMFYIFIFIAHRLLMSKKKVATAKRKRVVPFNSIHKFCSIDLSRFGLAFDRNKHFSVFCRKPKLCLSAFLVVFCNHI